MEVFKFSLTNKITNREIASRFFYDFYPYLDLFKTSYICSSKKDEFCKTNILINYAISLKTN